MDNDSFGSLMDVLFSRAPMIMVDDMISEPITICMKDGPHTAKHCNITYNGRSSSNVTRHVINLEFNHCKNRIKTGLLFAINAQQLLEYLIICDLSLGRIYIVYFSEKLFNTRMV